MALVRVAGVRLWLPGIGLRQNQNAPDPYVIVFTHLGVARLKALDGTMLQFAHDPRKTIMFYPTDAEHTRRFGLGGSEAHIGLTPEGPWRIEIQDLNRVTLDQLSDIVVEFEGHFVPEQ